MSGAGGGAGAGGGGGDNSRFISLGGVEVQIPNFNLEDTYAQEIRNVSICAAILQMSFLISDATVSAAIQSAATQALGLEAAKLAKEVSQPFGTD